MGTYNRQKRRLLHSKSVRIDVKEIKRVVGEVQGALGAGAFAVALMGRRSCASGLVLSSMAMGRILRWESTLRRSTIYI